MKNHKTILSLFLIAFCTLVVLLTSCSLTCIVQINSYFMVIDEEYKIEYLSAFDDRIHVADSKDEPSRTEWGVISGYHSFGFVDMSWSDYRNKKSRYTIRNIGNNSIRIIMRNSVVQDLLEERKPGYWSSNVEKKIMHDDLEYLWDYLQEHSKETNANSICFTIQPGEVLTIPWEHLNVRLGH